MTKKNHILFLLCVLAVGGYGCPVLRATPDEEVVEDQQPERSKEEDEIKEPFLELDTRDIKKELNRNMLKRLLEKEKRDARKLANKLSTWFIKIKEIASCGSGTQLEEFKTLEAWWLLEDEEERRVFCPWTFSAHQFPGMFSKMLELSKKQWGRQIKTTLPVFALDVEGPVLVKAPSSGLFSAEKLALSIDKKPKKKEELWELSPLNHEFDGTSLSSAMLHELFGNVYV